MKSSYLIILVVFLMACGSSARLKYAEKLYNEKSFAEAAKVCESIKGEDAQKYRILALSNFNMLKMDKAAEAFAKVPEETMSADEKLMYCEALKQMGNLTESVRLAQLVSAEAGGREVLYQNPLVKEAKTEIKVNVEEFNSLDDEMTPFYYVGDIYYMSNHATNYSPSSKFKWHDKPFLQISDSSGSYSNSFAAINSAMHDGPVTIAEDAGIMVINRNVAAKGKKAPAHLSLFEKRTSTLKDNKVTELSFCDKQSSYAHPFFNSKTNILFFSSNKPDGRGGMDLYSVVRNDDGTYGEPQAVAGNINTSDDEVYPTLVTDSILVFASDRASGFGGLDLYSCYMNRDGAWSEPKLLDLPLNSTRDDFYLINSLDTKGKYFITTNRDGNDNIYSVFIDNSLFGDWEVQLTNETSGEILRGLEVRTQYDLTSVTSENIVTDDSGLIKAKAEGGTLNIVAPGYKQAQITYEAPAHAYFRSVRQTLAISPITSLDVNGVVKDIESGEGIEGVTVYFNTSAGHDSLTSGSGGAFTQGLDLKALSENSLFDIELRKQGYAPKKISSVKIQSNNSQFDLNSICDLTMKKISVGDDLGALLAIQPIYFESAKWDVTAQGATELDKIAEILINNPDIKIECGSHTDCRGNKNANATLSSKRANSTVKYLLNKGVTQAQLKYKGYGEEVPVNGCICEGAKQTTCTEDELALNRRTEFKVLQKNESVVDTPDVATSSDSTKVSGNPIPTSSSTNNTSTTEVRVEGQSIVLSAPLEADRFNYGVDIQYPSSEAITKNNSLPAGKLYMIQVGAFREQIDAEIFNGIEPIYAERTKAGFTRYCVGMFTTYAKAEAALAVLQKRGFVDSFIVGYKEGTRVPVQTIEK